MHVSLHVVRNQQWQDLVTIELPHHAMHDILLHVDVVDKWLPSHPVRLVPKPQRRQPLRCTSVDLVQGVRHPPNVPVDQSIELADKVWVRFLHLEFNPSRLHKTKQDVSKLLSTKSVPMMSQCDIPFGDTTKTPSWAY
jgi:hypothetical protein